MLPRRGVEPERVLSCGDALNDVPMFNLTGLSVAVDDHLDVVKSSATSITRNKGPKGVIEMLGRLLED